MNKANQSDDKDVERVEGEQSVAMVDSNDSEPTSSAMDKSDEFDFEPIPQGELRERRLKLWKVGITAGIMVIAIFFIVMAMIFYSLGYNKNDDSSLTNANTTQSTASEDDVTIPESAATYQSPEVVGEGQIPDHYRGSADASVKAIEYADYTCSHCISLADELDDIYNQYGNDVQFIYRNYNVGFTYSGVTAKIAEAAYVVGGEDAYWKMHDKLFDDASTWSSSEYMDDATIQDKIRSYGDELGLDGQAIIDAYNDSANNGIDAKIERDRSLAGDSDVTGTPTWFIDGKKASSSADGIKSELDDILGK